MSISASPSITIGEPSVDDLKAGFDDGFGPEGAEHGAEHDNFTCLCSICCD